MGTRNLIEVKSNGEVKVAQYGQWDGYFTGQGAGIATFIHEEMDLEKFKTAVSNCSFHDKDSLDELQSKVDSGEIRYWQKVLPWLSRDAGSDVLMMIQENNGLRLRDESEFKNDDLFCEFYYLIDLDKETIACGDVCLPFSEWTVEKMSEIENQEDS